MSIPLTLSRQPVVRPTASVIHCVSCDERLATDAADKPHSVARLRGFLARHHGCALSVDRTTLVAALVARRAGRRALRSGGSG